MCGGTAQGNVMSSRGGWGEISRCWELPFVLCGCVRPLGHGTEGVSAPFDVQTHTHARTQNTRVYQSWPERRECLPTSLPACLPAGLERPGLKRTGTINVGFHVFHVLLCYLSACVRSALVFVWGVCVVWSGGKISCYFQMALFKRLLWCTKSDLKCACSCLWFSPKAPMARHAL